MPTHAEKVRYWTEMKCKAARNMAVLSEDTEPETESELKESLGSVVRHGSACDIAEAMVEAAEWSIANLMLKKCEMAHSEAMLKDVESKYAAC